MNMTAAPLIGQPVDRAEDRRFLTGAGTFVDDLKRDGMLHAVVLRSSVAHGRINGVDASAARAREGVRAVITAAEIGTIPLIPLRLANLPEFAPYLQPVIAKDKVRYVGEPIAVVVAETQALAEDALEAIDVDIAPLPPLPDRHAAASDKSLLFETSGSNRAVRYSVTSGDADAAFAKAEYTRRESFRCHRLTAVPLETRGLIAEWDAAKQKLVIFGATKVLFFNRRVLAPMLGLSEQAIDMIELDVGGGFGVRGEFYPEDFLIPFAARHVGRPVKWIEDRREHLMATNHSREVDCDLEIACTRDGTHPRLARPHLRRHGRLYPHQRRCRAGQGRAIPSGSLPHPRRRHHGRSADDEQDSRRHAAGARAVRSELLSRAAARHRGARPRPRSDGLPPQEPDQRGRASVRDRQARSI